jgi:hypothetical protein
MYEIQLHPANIRKQVRYYFLSRRAFHWLVGALVVPALLVLAGVVLARSACAVAHGGAAGLRQQQAPAQRPHHAPPRSPASSARWGGTHPPATDAPHPGRAAGQAAK